MTAWSTILLALGKRGPGWTSLTIPWAIISFGILVLGRYSRLFLLYKPSRDDLVDLEAVCCIGSFLLVLLRSPAVKRLLKLLFWPLTMRPFTPELIAVFSIHCILSASMLSIATVILGCLATHPPLLDALRSPYSRIVDSEFLDATFIESLFRSRMTFDPRIPRYALDAMCGSLILGCAPFLIYLTISFARLASLHVVTWRAKRRFRTLELTLVEAVTKLLQHPAGSPARVLHATQRDVLAKAIEHALRTQVTAELDEQIKKAAQDLTTVLQLRVADRTFGLDQIIRLNSRPQLNAKWQLRMPLPPNA